MDLELTIMNIINFSGDARSISMEAISYAKLGEIEKANKYIEDAAEKLAEAHRSQTKLISQEANGEGKPISLLLIHAQDHLMNAITIKDMATEFIELYKALSDMRGLIVNE